MKPYDADILFTSTLLGFDEPSCAIQADDQAACDLRIQSSAMSGLFNPVNDQHLCLLPPRAPLNIPKHALNPRDHLMTGGIAGFVEVYDTGANEGFEVSLERSTSHGNWSKVSGSDE